MILNEKVYNELKEQNETELADTSIGLEHEEKYIKLQFSYIAYNQAFIMPPRTYICKPLNT